MIKVIIIDDEPLARSIIIEYIKTFNDIEVVAECNNGYEGIKSITQHQPSLIFLDIQMPKINGFEMLELLPKSPAVIFTTAFDEYAIKAFETHAIDYLLKPFSKERFTIAIQKYKSQTLIDNVSQLPYNQFVSNAIKQPEEKNRIVVKKGDDIRIIPVEELYYIEAYDDYVKIFTKDESYLKKKTMNYYEQVLDNTSFFRVHRSYIINLNQLTKIESFEKNNYIAILKNQKQIPISRNNYSKLKTLLEI
ncbi:MAG: LytTR family DNA-binding domain-containing protein [Bacteroidia bacterium]